MFGPIFSTQKPIKTWYFVCNAVFVLSLIFKHISAPQLEQKLIDTVAMKKKLIKTRRKVDPRSRTNRSEPFNIQEVFDCDINHSLENSNEVVQTRTELPGGVSFKIGKSSKIKGDNDIEMKDRCKRTRDSQIIVGKTSLLLSILQVKTRAKCSDHSLISCWL